MRWFVRVSVRGEQWIHPGSQSIGGDIPDRFSFRPYDFGSLHPLRVLMDLWQPKFGVQYQTSWVERA